MATVAEKLAYTLRSTLTSTLFHLQSSQNSLARIKRDRLLACDRARIFATADGLFLAPTTWSSDWHYRSSRYFLSS